MVAQGGKMESIEKALGEKSKQLFEEAEKYLVGGVNSPVRAMKPYPFFVSHGKGSRLFSVDGKSFIDYCLGYGPLILGHANEIIVKAVCEQIKKGSVFGTPHELEINFAEKIANIVPSAEVTRFVNTGTEATMAAIRLARGYTKRKKIIKFEGAFHGAHDYVLVKAGSGATTLSMPNSLGIPEDTTRNTILAPFNDENAIEKIVKKHGNDIACIILEPIIGNAGCILPKEGYLKFLREITHDNGILLIFDEIITGFRVSLGGAQERYSIIPDLTTLGKILGGGLPIGAITGKREIMEKFSPIGKVYQAGTFNGNPLSLAAGFACISYLEKNKSKIYREFEEKQRRITKALEEITTKLGIDARVYGIASMFQIYFSKHEIIDYSSALKSNTKLFMRFHEELLKRGIFLPPSQYECNFISTMHSNEDIEETIIKMEEAIREAKRK